MIALLALVAFIFVVGGGIEVLRRARFGLGTTVKHHKALDKLGSIATSAPDDRVDLAPATEGQSLAKVRRAVETDPAQPRISPLPVSHPVAVPAITGGSGFVGTIPVGDAPGRGPDTEIEGVRVLRPEPAEDEGWQLELDLGELAEWETDEVPVIEDDDEATAAEDAGEQLELDTGSVPVVSDVDGDSEDGDSEDEESEASDVEEPDADGSPADDDEEVLDDFELAAAASDAVEATGDESSGWVDSTDTWVAVDDTDGVLAGDGDDEGADEDDFDVDTVFAGTAAPAAVAEPDGSAAEGAEESPAEDEAEEEDAAEEEVTEEEATEEHELIDLPALETGEAPEEPAPAVVSIGSSTGDLPDALEADAVRAWLDGERPDPSTDIPSTVTPPPAAGRSGTRSLDHGVLSGQPAAGSTPEGGIVEGFRILDGDGFETDAPGEPVLRHLGDAEETRTQLAALAESGGMDPLPSSRPHQRTPRRGATYQMRQRRKQAAKSVGGVVVGIAALVALVFALSTGGGSSHHQKRTVQRTAAPTSVSTPSTTAAAKAASLVSRTSSTATYSVTGSPTITLAPSQACWMEIRQGTSSGTVLFEGVLPAGQAKHVNPSVWVRLGNPNAVNVSVGNTTLESPQVATGSAFNLQFQ